MPDELQGSHGCTVKGGEIYGHGVSHEYTPHTEGLLHSRGTRGILLPMGASSGGKTEKRTPRMARRSVVPIYVAFDRLDKSLHVGWLHWQTARSSQIW